MVRNAWYLIGRTLFLVLWVGAVGVLMLGYAGSSVPFLNLLLVFVLAMIAATVPHELGHALACWAVDAEIKAFMIGRGRLAFRFRVRSVQVSLGWPNSGRVLYEGAYSVRARAAVTLAGSVANIGLAALILLCARLAVPGPGAAHDSLMAAALGMGVVGAGNLLPFRTNGGQVSDGARLWLLRSDIAAEKVNRAARRMLQAGSAAELLDLHSRLEVPDRPLSADKAGRLALAEYTVTHLAGLPAEHAALAERRVSALLPVLPEGPARSAACLALALLRLRQAGPGPQAEAERLGGRALSGAESSENLRLCVFAVVVASRQSRGLPYEDVLRRAAAARPAVSGPDVEAQAAEFRAIADPAAFLAAFRAGVPGTLLGASPVAALLRSQGRRAELLELHRGFAAPGGLYAGPQMRALHGVEYQLLLMPGVPTETADEQAARIEWILGHYPFESAGDRMPRPGVQHSLALARLRQRRFAEVEPLCRLAVAGHCDPDDRATVLATIALARRGLGQDHAELVAQAVALSPGADLVAEAAAAGDRAGTPAGARAGQDRDLAAGLAPAGQPGTDSA